MVVPNPLPGDGCRRVGKVLRAHGLKGELKIVCLAATPDQFRHFYRVALAAADGRMTEFLPITSIRGQGKQVILKLATIDNRNEAELTAGMDVLIADDGPPVDPDHLEHYRLPGLPVRTSQTGQLVGMVVGSFDNGAHQVLVVQSGAREILIPLVPDIVVEATVHGILIDPPDGLLELDEAAADEDR